MIALGPHKSLGYGQVGSCFIYASSKSPPAAADWETYIAFFRKALSAPGGPPLMDGTLTVLVYERTSGPNAAQRKQLNDLVSALPLRVAVVTNSAIARGVLTAMSWFAKGKGYHPFTPDEVEQALEFLKIDAAAAGNVRSHLRDLLRQLDDER